MGWAEDARKRGLLSPIGSGVPGALPPPRDRFGTSLSVGDLVVYHPPMDLVFQIQAIDILPNVDPLVSAKRGALILVLETHLPLEVRANDPLAPLIFVRHAPQQADGQADGQAATASASASEAVPGPGPGPGPGPVTGTASPEDGPRSGPSVVPDTKQRTGESGVTGLVPPIRD